MIILKSKDEIEKMRVSNRMVAEILQELKAAVRPGITTLELDRLAEKKIRQRGAIPAFKGYRGFPASICTSINEEVVHGIPSAKRKLRSGDLLSIDLGVLYDGYYGDSAITVGVGKIDPEGERLLRVTEEALRVGIAQVKEGNFLSDVSHAIQQYVEEHGYNVVRVFVGHGIGTSLHEEPQVPNFGPPGRGPKLRPGMVLAIEPMVNIGSSEVEVLEDQWTVVTVDRKRSAHFEHTVALTENGAEILTCLDSC
ncbi:MAG: type I methionyl aminopeptidase [Nitrospinota bacterium]|nr:MAG: type I methionyl aminopeptidase [Nitrospinota bacterium]